MIGILMFAFFIYIGILNQSKFTDMFMMGLLEAGMIYFWLLTGSYIEMNESRITVSAPHGRYQIAWDEITSVITNGQTYALQGDNKRLTISLTLASKTAQQARELLLQQCSSRSIEIQESTNPPLKHLNVKIK